MEARLEQSKIRAMEPLNRLPEADQDALLNQATFIDVNEGEVVYRQGDQDDNANFLLEGSVEILWGGKPVKVVDARDKAATQVLDSSGAKRFTVVAKSAACLLRLSRSQLDQKLRSASIASKLSVLKGDDDSDSRWPAWKMRQIQSPLFKVLPISQLKEVLNRMERVSVDGGDVVVHQGSEGNDYFVVDDGACTVTREVTDGGVSIHVADLGPGEAFGEEALVTGALRNATVAAQGTCQLLRLDRRTFMDLVYTPLVSEVSSLRATELIDEGAIWLDVRAPDRYAAGSLTDAINMPLTLLRVDCARLSNKYQYIVGADAPGAAQVGTLLLRQRGFDAVCLTQSIEQMINTPQASSAAENEITVVPFPAAPPSEPIAGADATAQPPLLTDTAARASSTARPTPALESSEPIPRDLYDDTLVGQNLADLIDQMHARHVELNATEADSTATVAKDVDLSGFRDEMEHGLPGVADEQPPSLEQPAGTAPSAVPLPRSADMIDEVSHLTGVFEVGLRAYVEAKLEDERVRQHREVAEYIVGVKQSAVREVRRQAGVFRDHFREEQVQKRTAMKREYDKLMALAHKITRQKAELRTAQRELQRKLQSTAQLQTEIDSIRSALTVSIGNFDSLEDELSESL